MQKLLTILLFVSCTLLGLQVQAQELLVTGKVTDAGSGAGLPGVNVVVKGSKTGTITDADGNYRLSVADPNGVLTFSFIGFVKQEIVIGSQSTVNCVLKEDTQVLQEVVVTSFGVEREKKELGYAVQEVKGAEVAETLRPNFINALQGRVAGVQIGTTNGMPGASSSIVIRGGNSIGGNNQPLFVVDGVPVDNSTMGEGLLVTDAANRNADFTNRIADINPNDIESITVLKGPAAAALYGIDAANGAIVITTKKGKKGTAKVDYSANFMWEQITRTAEPQTQTKFANGQTGVTNESSLFRWGGERTGGTPLYDNVKNFFQTGFTQTHNIGVSGGSEAVTYNASANIWRQEGTVPNAGFDRNSLRLNMTAQVSPKIKFNGSINYTNSLANRASKGTRGFYYETLIWNPTLDVQNYESPDGRPLSTLEDLTVATPVRYDNPNYNARKNVITDETDRFLLNGSLSYDPFEWLNLTARIGSDFYNTIGQSVYNPLTQQPFWYGADARVPNRLGGIFFEYTNTSKLINGFLLATAKKKFGDINTSFTAGYNFDDKTYRVDSRYGERFLVDNLPSIVNTTATTRQISTRGTRRRLIGVFGDLRLDYKNMIFLNITGRNDWSSTLPEATNNFFYPSISTGVVVSDLLGLESRILSFAKIRASYAEVGKDALPHQVLPSLQEFLRTGGGYNVGFFGPNNQIRPERTQSFEIGTDLRFLNNRISLDLTYYNTRSSDQIIQTRLSYATGYILQLINSGTIENQGLEALLNAEILKNDKLSWNLTANFTMNRNKVIQMPANLPEFYLSDTWLAGNARGGYVLNESYMSITGNSFRTHSSGQPLIGANGYPVTETAFVNIGNRQPNFTLGITNNVRYKNFNLSFLFDIRQGGDVFNATEMELTRLGISNRTLDRGTTRVFPGVLADGTPNTLEVPINEAYYRNGNLGSNPVLFIEKDIYWVRLRDITLTYQVPAELLSFTKIVKTFSVNLTGTNLWLQTNYKGADPDVNGLNASARGAGAVGFDSFTVAPPVTFAIGVKAGF